MTAPAAARHYASARRRIPVFLSTRTCVDLPVGDTLALAEELGYDGVELWMDEVVRDPARPASIARDARSRGLQLSVHAFSYDINPTSVNRGIREESVRQVLSSLETAAVLGARVVVVHPGVLSSRADRAADYWEPQLAFFRTVAKRAAELGVVACAEQMEKTPTKHIFCTAADVNRLRAALAAEQVAIDYALDLAHIHTWGIAVTDFLRDAGLPGHVHCSDASSRKTHEAAIGEGDTDVAAAIAALVRAGYPHAIAVEGVARGRARAVAASNLRIIDAALAAAG